MREIKFRAWDKKEQGFVEKFHIYNNGTMCAYGDIPGVCDHEKNIEYFTENVVLMQYTELKDKNGKEIYEGDIVTYYCGSDKQARPMAVEIPGIYISDNASDGYMATHTYEVIGNIYENPELPCQ